MTRGPPVMNSGEHEPPDRPNCQVHDLRWVVLNRNTSHCAFPRAGVYGLCLELIGAAPGAEKARSRRNLQRWTTNTDAVSWKLCLTDPLCFIRPPLTTA